MTSETNRRWTWLAWVGIGLLIGPEVAATPPNEADPAETAAAIYEATGIRGGLVVHLPCGDGQLTAALHARPSHLVHGLDPDPEQVRRTRQRMADQGLAGRVTIDRLPPDHLPYLDQLVRLLIVEDPELVTEQEMMRVLAPGGIAWVRGDGGWEPREKPWPTDIDGQWNHYLRGPDNNAVAQDAVVGPPRHMRWVADPLWTRNHHTLNTISSAVTSGGRLFYITDQASPANIQLPAKWTIVARDAFNGVTLWERPMASWLNHQHGFRSGPPQAPRLLVASDDVLYTPLELSGPIVALDTASGQTLRTFDDTVGAEEILLSGDTLLALVGDPQAEQAFTWPDIRQRFGLPNEKSLVAIDIESGDLRWRWQPEGHPVPKTLATDGQRAYLRVGQGLVAVEMSDGRVRWRYGRDRTGGRRQRIGFGQHSLVVAGGVVLFNLGDRLVAVCAEDGQERWDAESGSGFRAPPDILVTAGVVWHKVDHRAGSVSPFPRVEARDLQTGEVLVQSPVAERLKSAGHHYRCYRAKATERFVIAGKRGVEMIDLAGDGHSRNNWVRGSCQYGVLPANGLLYVPPHSCGCYMETMLHGFWALADDRTEEPGGFPPIPATARLERFHDFDPPADPEDPQGDPEDPPADAEDPLAGEAWPTWRGDPLRRGVAATEIGPELQPVWQVALGGRLTPPVAAEGKVLVASSDQGRLHAVDARTGEVVWRYAAGGRIDSPPTIHRSRVLFGSADGKVTCLRLADGQPLWQFTAAPAELRTVAFDRLESPWPVHGSVLVLDNVAYCAAGRSSWLDGGIHLYALDPATGQVLHHTQYQSEHPEYRDQRDEDFDQYHQRIDQNVTDDKTFVQSDRSDAFSMAGGSIADVLVSDGWHIFLHHKKFNTRLEKQPELGRHLFSTSSLLDDTENHRSHWFLGTGDFSRIPVAYSWIVNSAGGSRGGTAVAAPTGVQLVFDDQAVWGVQRPERHQAAGGEYLLFRKSNRPFSPDEPPQPDFRRDAERRYEWRHELGGRPTAMLKSGDYLVLGVSPVELPEDDPHAAYEGRLGGGVWVHAAADGRRIARYPLDARVLWDGLAAADQQLYVSTEDGALHALAAP